MKPEKTLQYRPISIEAIGQYEYKVAFQQTSEIISHIFNTLPDCSIGQFSTEFWNAMGAHCGPGEMLRCVLALDSCRIDRCNLHDVAVYGHSPSGCKKENKKMAVEPLSITVCGDKSYTVKFNNAEQREFVFEIVDDGESKVKFENDFEQFIKSDIDPAKLLEAINYFHMARTDKDFAE